MTTYRRLDPIDRDEAEVLLGSDNGDTVAETILRLALHDQDPDWTTNRVLAFAGDPDKNIGNSVITALGHIARIHRHIDRDKVVPVLHQMAADPTYRGRVEDTLDDIAIFAPPQ